MAETSCKAVEAIVGSVVEMAWKQRGNPVLRTGLTSQIAYSGSDP
jgi:hypothetical protein